MAATSNHPRALTGLLLGAGASYDLGMPLVWELTDKLKRWLTPDKLRSLNGHWRSAGPGFGYPDEVIEDLRSVLERKDMHYENILGYLQVQSHRSSYELQSYSGLYMFIMELVYGIMQEQHLLRVDYIQKNIRYLDGITVLAEANVPLWIFSLNYDLIIECFAADVGIRLASGFTQDTVSIPKRNEHGALIGVLEAEVLPEQVLKTQGLPFFNDGEQGLNLLKIHGSLDVFTFRDGHDVLKFLPCGSGVRGVLESLRGANHDLRYIDPMWPGGVVHSINEIVYADEMEEMQFLRRSLLAGAYKFDDRYNQVIPNELLNHFESNLNRLTSLVCLGYGYGDQHINRVIRNWLEFRGERHLIIVDPNISDVPSAFLHLASQVELIAFDCTTYLDQIGNINRSPLEQAERRLDNWTRNKGAEAYSEFDAFLQQELYQCADKVIEWGKSLPMSNGDIDLEALELPLEELTKSQLAEMPSMAEIIMKFLKQQEGFSSKAG